MSSMAKIFVVLNLVFVLMLFGAAATLMGAQDNYKVAAETTSRHFDEFKTQQAAEIARLNTELASQNQRAAQMTTERNTAVADKDAMRTTALEAKQLVDKHAATIEALTEELKGLRASIDQMKGLVDAATKRADEDTSRANNLKSQYDTEVSNRVRLEGDLSRASEERDELAKRVADLDKSLRDANFWLGEYRSRYPDIQGPKGSEGVVKEVGRTGHVAISVGSTSGVRMGDEYHISRGDRYVCSIKIIQVEPQLAVGRVVDGSPTDAFPPQAGDKTWAR